MSATPRFRASIGACRKSLSASRKSSSLSSAPVHPPNNANTSNGKEDGSGLIVTRGLQEILDHERRSRSMKKATATVPSEGSSKSKVRRRGSGQAPNFIICYLCGRQFGTASIDIHRPQCYLKRLIAWERGEPATRGPKPLDPKDHEKAMSRVANIKAASGSAVGGSDHLYASGKSFGGTGKHSSLSEIEAYNQLQMNAFNEVSLSPCPNCGRTFLPDRLQVHLRSCRPGKPLKPLRAVATPAAPPVVTHVKSREPIRAAAQHTGAADNVDDDVLSSAGPSRQSPSRAKVSSALRKEDAAVTSPQSLDRAKSASNISHLSTDSPIGGGAAAEEQHREIIEVELELDDDDSHLSPPHPNIEHPCPSPAAMHRDPNSLATAAAKRLPRESSSVRRLSSSPVGPEEQANGNGNGCVGSQSLSSEKECAHPVADEPSQYGTRGIARSADRPEVTEAAHDEGDAGTDAEQRSAARFGASVQDGPGSGADPERRGTRRIQLNNVSRFKSVTSKLNLQKESAEVHLVPCTHCARKFLPSRIQKHESCCIERNRPPAVRRTTALATPRPAKPTQAAVGKSTSVCKANFCGGCGSKVSLEGQRFCTECGLELYVASA